MKAAGESIQGRGGGRRRRSFITSWGPMGFAALSSKPFFKIAAVAVNQNLFSRDMTLRGYAKEKRGNMFYEGPRLVEKKAAA